MSSDLWAEFGGGSGAENPWSSNDTHTNPNARPTHATSTTQTQGFQAGPFDPWSTFEAPKKSDPIPPPAAAIEDEWSAFETAESAATSQPTTTAWPAQQAVQDEWAAFEAPSNTITKTETTFNANGLMWDADSALQPAAAPQSAGGLIDISGLDISGTQADDDDFGDFEEAQVPTPMERLPTPDPPAKTIPNPDVTATIMQNRIETQGAGAANKLIFGAVKKGSSSANVKLEPPQKPATRAPKPMSMSTKTTGSTSTKTTSQPKHKSTPAPAPAPLDDDFDEEAWDDFNSLPPSPATSKPSSKSAPSSSSQPTPSLIESSEPSTLPPSNIPPPSVLLSLLHTTIIPTLSSTRSSTNPNPTLRTTGRMLAGRKSRWKRDTHLAQSMSISAAGPGLKSGMKLTGVDKSEAVREDREAAEVTRVFKQNAGALRARAVKAGDKGIVDLGTVGRVENGMTGGGAGLKPCVICGLRRPERVVGVDAEVYDGFGEWWVEHWGHKECKVWWEENEGNLAKR